MGIVNLGSINTLNNLQGEGNLSGPLTYAGILPLNYAIIIRSIFEYGQLSVSGLSYGQIVLSTASGPMSFSIYSGSNVSPGTYYNVLQGFNSLGDVSGATGIYGEYTYSLVANASAASAWNLLISPRSSNIGMGQASYAISNLGSSVTPVFAGGTLVIDSNAQTYTQNFSLDGSSTNTINQNGNSAVLAGVISDATLGGKILFANGGAGGSVTLSGANTYSGGTTIQGGATVLVGSDTALGTGIVNMEEGSALGFHSGGGSGGISIANDFALSGDPIFITELGATNTLSGVLADGAQAGDVVVRGAGTLVLTGANTYSGGTTIDSGSTLQIGAGGTVGSVIGAIINNGALVSNRSDAAMLSSAVSGIGSLLKSGAGTLTLSGANTYSGGTTVSVGTLTGDSISLQGAINNNAALEFAQASNGTYSGSISGIGSLLKSGAGTLTLSGASTYSGGATVSAGRLNVTGSLASSAVTVLSGASLGGTGTVGALTAMSGSTVNPGSSIGELAVNGGLTLAAGSTLAIEVSPTGADRISATGAASISGNLVVTPGFGAYTTFNQSFTLISSSARTGTFASSALGNYGAAFAPDLIYNGTSVILRLAPASLVTQSGELTGNALAVATSFDEAAQGGYNPQSFFELYTQGANLSAALGQFSGEIHSAERRTELQGSRVVRDAALDRLSDGLVTEAGTRSLASEHVGKSTSIWIRAADSWGTAKADGTGAKFKTEQAGVLTGVDFASNGFKFGGMFSYTSADLSFASLGQSNVKSTGGAIYAGYRQDGAGFAVGMGGAIAGTTDTDSRSITLTGLSQTLKGKVNGTSAQIFGEASYDLASAENVRIEPFARLAGVKIDSKAFAETGGVAALSGVKQSNNLTMTTLGLRGVYINDKAALSSSVGWQSTGGDRSAPTALEMTVVNTPYEVRSAALDKSAVALEAQASFHLSPNATLSAGYNGVIGSKNSDHGARATISYAW